MQTSVYLVLRPQRNYWGDIRSFIATRMTKNKPKHMRHDEVAVCLTINVPVEVFAPEILEVTAAIDPAHVIKPIVVESVEP